MHAVIRQGTVKSTFLSLLLLSFYKKRTDFVGVVLILYEMDECPPLDGCLFSIVVTCYLSQPKRGVEASARSAHGSPRIALRYIGTAVMLPDLVSAHSKRGESKPFVSAFSLRCASALRFCCLFEDSRTPVFGLPCLSLPRHPLSLHLSLCLSLAPRAWVPHVFFCNPTLFPCSLLTNSLVLIQWD